MSQEIMQLFFPWLSFKKNIYIYQHYQYCKSSSELAAGCQEMLHTSYAYHVLTKLYATGSCVKGEEKKVLISKGPTSFSPPDSVR